MRFAMGQAVTFRTAVSENGYNSVQNLLILPQLYLMSHHKSGILSPRKPESRVQKDLLRTQRMKRCARGRPFVPFRVSSMTYGEGLSEFSSLNCDWVFLLVHHVRVAIAVQRAYAQLLRLSWGMLCQKTRSPSPTGEVLVMFKEVVKTT